MFQKNLTIMALDQIVLCFEENWKASTQDVRAKHMIEGHVWTCLTSPDQEQHHRLCGGITHCEMNKDQGAGFTHLL
jgi:hypothetical protein